MGLAIQKISYNELPEDAPSSFQGLSVSEADASLDARRNEIRQTLGPEPADLLTLPSHVLQGYAERLRLFGEFEANQWLNNHSEFRPGPDRN